MRRKGGSVACLHSQGFQSGTTYLNVGSAMALIGPRGPSRGYFGSYLDRQLIPPVGRGEARLGALSTLTSTRGYPPMQQPKCIMHRITRRVHCFSSPIFPFTCASKFVQISSDRPILPWPAELGQSSVSSLTPNLSAWSPYQSGVHILGDYRTFFLPLSLTQPRLLSNGASNGKNILVAWIWRRQRDRNTQHAQAQ